MSAVDVNVAKAVVAQLLEAVEQERITVPDGLEFSPQRSHGDWEEEFDDEHACDEGRLYIDVVTDEHEQKATAAAKGRKLRYEVPIVIGIRRKFGQSKLDDETLRVRTEEIDALKLMVQQVFEEFTTSRLTTFDAGAWQETELVVNPSSVHLRKFQQFTSIVVVIFEVTKTVGE